MPTSLQRRLAEQVYKSGHSLFQKGLYKDALIELRQAEKLFRSWEATGHPLPHYLTNGVSGLANTLVVTGLCHQQLGDFRSALTCYETSRINSKFEKKKAFSTFTKTFAQQLIICYEHKLSEADGSWRDHLDRDPEIDISFRFPYSLPPAIIPVARLYELAPERYPQYRDYYQRAQKKDSTIRRKLRTSDESAMRRMSIYVWSILITILIVYGFFVLDTLHRNQ